LAGPIKKTCGSNCKWGACKCDAPNTMMECTRAGGLWSLQVCECLCCGTGCTPQWDGTTPICNCPIGGGNSPFGYRSACVGSHVL
jgi:hypothetical protein